MLSEAAPKAAAGQLLPILGLGLLAALVVAGVAGLYAGNRWAEGAAAIKQSAQQQDYIEQLHAEAELLRSVAAQAALDYASAADRQEAIATELETDREANRKHYAAQRADLEKLLAARPDLRVGRAGADVLQHWNRANEGTAAPVPTAGAGGQPEAGVPAAAGGDVGPVGGADREPRPGRGAVPRLQGEPQPADPGSNRVGAHGVELVLPGAGATAGARR